MAKARTENNKRTAAATPERKTPASPASGIHFEAALREIGSRAILVLPEAASKQLPSRGQVAVRGTMNGHAFQTVVEPDGDFGHWMSVDAKLRKAAGVAPGEKASVDLQPSKEWPEPKVPKDLQEALSGAPKKIQDLWQAITPMARWEWVRWVNETKNPATRARRVEVSISKLDGGKRRPCCFNLASCTDPDLAKSGKLALE